MIESIMPESQFQRCIELGIYKESDRHTRVAISKKLRIIDFGTYEKNFPNTPLNMRGRYIKKHGIIDGIKHV